MWRVSARDLQFRARRFVIAVVVTSLVFGVALAIDGMRRAVQGETPSIVRMFGADEWIVAKGTTGPFTSTRVIPASVAQQLQGAPGVRRADPVVLSRTVLSGSHAPMNVNLIGHVPGGLGSPPIHAGRDVQAQGEAVVSAGSPAKIGDVVSVGGQPFHVVGVAKGGRFVFGIATVFVGLSDAQQLVFNWQPLAMAIAVHGTPGVPQGMSVATNAQVETDLDRPLKNGYQSIVVTAILMWIIAAGIIGLIVYLSAIERTRDFAVFKATGAPNRIIVGGLMLQAVMVAVLAAVLAIGVSRLVATGLPFQSALQFSAVVQLLLISLVVGGVASLVGVRRALSTDPAVAFGGK